jgi:hypothetical protein
MLTKLKEKLSSKLRAIVCEEVGNQLSLNEKFACRNIELELQYRALRSTADYVEKHMADVRRFSSKFDLLSFALSQVKLSGLFCEFGVYTGGTINHIAKHTQSQVFGFDSFEGLPERWQGQEAGRFAVPKLPEVLSNVQLVKGWFNESLPPFVKEHTEPAAFLHIDCDLYSSTRLVFEQLGRQIVPGTIMVFDEYFNYSDWQNGEYKAFQEMIKKSALHYEYIGYNQFEEQVAVRIQEGGT